jgi:DNA-directed RNA polymerase sigma subunit (sigma70/sigma32)
MRELKITKKTKSNLSIDEFENKTAALIARQFSSTQIELRELYEIGLNGLEKAKNTFANDQNKFERFSNWFIRQEIITFKNNKSSNK